MTHTTMINTNSCKYSDRIKNNSKVMAKRIGHRIIRHSLRILTLTYLLLVWSNEEKCSTSINLKPVVKNS